MAKNHSDTSNKHLGSDLDLIIKKNCKMENQTNCTRETETNQYT